MSGRRFVQAVLCIAVLCRRCTIKVLLRMKRQKKMLSTLHIMIIGWIDTKLAKIKETFLLHESHKSSRECLVSYKIFEVIFLCRVLIDMVGESVDVHFSLFCVGSK
jgi:hypothetical protein